MAFNLSLVPQVRTGRLSGWRPSLRSATSSSSQALRRRNVANLGKLRCTILVALHSNRAPGQTAPTAL